MIRNTYGDRGLGSIKTLDNIKKYEFSFEAVENDYDAQLYGKFADDYVKEYGEAETIFVVVPTEHYRMGSADGMQEVEVKRVIKGDKGIAGNKIWINGMPIFNYYEEEGTLKVDTLLNWMQEGEEYLVACKGYGPFYVKGTDASRFYTTDSIFGYLNLTHRKAGGKIVNEKDSYTLEELKNCEFFAGSRKVIEEKQKIKEKILQMYLKS